MRRLEGKVALVTGAAAGIGRASAARLAAEGARVFLADLAEEGLRESAQLIQAEHGAQSCALRACDVSQEADVQKTVAACVEEFGRLDVLCNIAGVLLLQHFEKISTAQFKRVLDVNLTGTFLFCRTALPHLLESGGNIVNISSTSALSGMAYAAAYGASKAGVSALTRGIAAEFAHRGLRCNAINPGSIKTAMASRKNMPQEPEMKLLARAMPLDKPRGPESIAGVVAMLASEDAAHINGCEIRVDGGTLA